MNSEFGLSVCSNYLFAIASGVFLFNLFSHVSKGSWNWSVYYDTSTVPLFGFASDSISTAYGGYVSILQQGKAANVSSIAWVSKSASILS